MNSPEKWSKNLTEHYLMSTSEWRDDYLSRQQQAEMLEKTKPLRVDSDTPLFVLSDDMREKDKLFPDFVAFFIIAIGLGAMAWYFA